MVERHSGRGPRGLSPERIVNAAVGLLEEGGQESFSLRGVARAAGCDAMSVAYHFGSKEGLTRAMASWLDARVRPAAPGEHWRSTLLHLAEQYRALARSYPRTFPLLQRFTHTGSADYATTEVVHAAMAGAGIPRPQVVTVTVGWFAMVLGLATAEALGMMAPVDSATAVEIEALPAEDYPLTTALLADYRGIDPGVVFGTAVDLMHDGIERLAGGARGD
ncbi:MULTISPECIES: TetR/AcrR family transcriptional regulator [unclassified Dietzia]|uniref:TetR/AcrR family transcriptional regulator n=1 Tax=unclassified Dietzia TaxID=2617939 RepID=UPI000D20D890|nr:MULTISPECIES: TetR/AcrR family transcriptional regulator [unclassified Dietzia]AVZ40773.1 TetR family transcriptional regulator [Dietzia sp. JS16-p6b]QGW26371.1 transcriptional regulator, TetR family protein [Dietzia sp. DQ12-45-1b]